MIEPEQLGSLSQYREFSPLQGNSFYAAQIIVLNTASSRGERRGRRERSEAVNSMRVVYV